MIRKPTILLRLAALIALGLGPPAHAAEKPLQGTVPSLPKPADVSGLEVFPSRVALDGADDSAQLVVTGTLAAGLQDLTGEVQYEIANSAVARVTASGRVLPVGNGETEVTVRYGDKAVSRTVSVQHFDVDLPINFANHVVPIFTKLGCNAGGCHGKSGGQNGFALSLLGFTPEFDYQTLVKEDRGRRLLPAAPEHSLLLLKATGQIAHGGGRRIEPNSDEYKRIRRWIASGNPYGSPSDPTVVKISVFPETRVLTRNNRQQFAVHAHYSNGAIQDVTHLAQYESNDGEIAVVDRAALVRTLDRSGEAAVMARFQGQVAVFRATVPLGVETPQYEFEQRTIVDRWTHKKWQQLGVVPAGLSSDEVFLRRVSLDLTGTLPTPEQVRAFLADEDPNKRDQLIDRLLETCEHAFYFANKWADVLRVKRRGQPARAEATFAFHNWIRETIAQDLPYDQFVRSILTASGEPAQAPPTLWFRELERPEHLADDTAQVFLGQRLACAQCHHHPYEKWSQDDYWGLAAFFSRVGRKNVLRVGGFNGQQDLVQIIFNAPRGTVVNKRTGKPAAMVPLGGKPVTVDRDDDPRHKLVDWMTDPENPYFARAVANRYWAHFFGRGIVEPLDDLRITNPPSNPELLDALAKELIDHKFSLKHLIKTIVRSRTYQLSAEPNEFNQHDRQSFARFYPRRMKAEVLYDAVNQATNAPSNFGGLPADPHAPRRAIMLPDESFGSYFLDVFGRPQRISACECERVSEANLAQSLHLLNSQEVQNKLAAGGGRADLLARDKRPDAEKIEELFLWAVGRRPSPEHLQEALAHVARHPQNKKIAYENLLWALINTKEFVFIQ